MFSQSPMSAAGALLPLLGAVCWGEIQVTSILYGTAQLPCSFHFIEGVENLLVIWEKAGKDGKNVQVYKSEKGRHDPSNQDSQFRDRIVFSGDISRGKLDLTLIGVTWNDDAVYYCRAANKMNHGDNVVVLSVSALPPQTIQRAVEDDVTLVPKFSGVPTEINWKVNSNKLVDMELESPERHFYFLEERAELQRNGSLTIRNLTKEDSGAYKSEVLVNNFIQETEIRLTVFDRVPEPTIIDRSTDQAISLRCVSSAINASYKWRVNNGNGTETTEQDYVAPRPREDVTVSCTVSDGVSEGHRPITILSESQRRHHYIIFLLSGILLLLLLAAAVHFLRGRWTFNYHSGLARPTPRIIIDAPNKRINGCERAENGTMFDENKVKTPIKGSRETEEDQRGAAGLKYTDYLLHYLVLRPPSSDSDYFSVQSKEETTESGGVLEGLRGTEEDQKDAADPEYNGNAQCNGLTKFHKASSEGDHISEQSEEEPEPVHVLEER